MTSSVQTLEVVSTPRVRLTQAWYALMLGLVAFGAPSAVLSGWPGEIANVLGLMSMLFAAVGRIWIAAFIAGRKGKHLVTEGPYSLCRHPLYALSLVGGLGVGLASRSLLVTAGTIGFLGFVTWRAMLAEERYLRSSHGNAHEDYCRRVPLLWPSWKHRRTAVVLTLPRETYWRAFTDAGTFMTIYALIQVLDALRTAQFWPTLFTLF